MKLLILLVCALTLCGRSVAGEFTLHEGTLRHEAAVVLERVPSGFAVRRDRTGTGVFLTFTPPRAASLVQTPLGRLAGLRRFTSAHRDEPFWMLPRAGTNEAQVALETQWLLAETAGGDCVMLVPLLTDTTVFTLSGDTNGLRLTGETGDAAILSRGGAALFVAVGRDPYQLAERGAKAVMKFLGTGRLRRDKPVPAFVDDFGWCTWDSFYKEVSAAGVRRGLESFRAGGVEPRLLILDDGWQDYRLMPGGEERLVSLEPNQARFAGDLRPTVRLARDDYGIRTLLVWHAFIGYWGGVDGASLPQYQVQDRLRSFGPGILAQHPNLNTQYWGSAVGVIPPSHIGKFYNDYHRRLEAAGVDGVKVDNQSMIESVAQGLGGRVAVTKAYRAALEQSVHKHLDGRLINCMANALETYYGSPRSTLMRTSIDFWPKRPETHGRHLYCNAQMGVWFGQFMQPDWDMFQSAHNMGAFHAAGRAVSGGPVYVSDTPEAHDFGLLRKLVLSDGTILRAAEPGRPTRDCLFADVTRDPVLLKVFSYNRASAVIGVFNCNHHPDATPPTRLAGSVSPADVPGLRGEEFVGFAHQANRLWRTRRTAGAPVTLGEGEWEIVTFAPLERGVAVLGLADKFNGGGAIRDRKWNRSGSLTVRLRDGGTFLAWSDQPLRSLTADGKPVTFEHDPDSRRISVEVAVGGERVLVLHW
jgi:raffinose synthase